MDELQTAVGAQTAVHAESDEKSDIGAETKYDPGADMKTEFWTDMNYKAGTDMKTDVGAGMKAGLIQSLRLELMRTLMTAVYQVRAYIRYRAEAG